MADDLKDIAERLRARRAAALAEAAVIQKMLEDIGKSGVFIGSGSTLPQTSDEYTKLGTTEGAKRFLQEIGRPATSREIWDALASRGLRTGSDNPINSLGSSMRQAKKIFKHLEDGTWTLVNENSRRT